MKRIKLSILTLAAALPAATIVAGSAVGSNLILDPGFDSGIAGWDNYSGNPQHENGTLKITNDYTGIKNSYYSGWYCAPVTEGVNYAAKADYFVPVSAPENTGASFDIHYFASPDCSGSNLVTGGGGVSGGRQVEQRGLWLQFSFETVAPATAKSARVRATAFKEPKPYESSIPETHYVYFDNVFFGEAATQVINEPPANEPPANEPPANEPPADEPPADEPPAQEPPMDEPPIDEPPVQDPPAGEPPADEPPADESPVFEPPIFEFPVEEPPASEPPAQVPPADEPSVDQPAEQPQAQQEAEDPQDDPQPGAGESTTEPATTPGTFSDVPLPPATGDSQLESERNTRLFLASIASMASGLALFGLLVRKARRERNR